MAISLNSVTRRKLILVKRLYQRAILHAQVLHSDIDRIMSVIEMDLAIETILKAVVGDLDTKNPPEPTFWKLRDQASRLLLANNLPDIPDPPKIKIIHEHRNDSQHKLKYPSIDDVSYCRTYTRDILKAIVTNVWNEDFESLSLVDVVQNAKVRGYLAEAETQLAKRDYIKAVLKSICAFDWTIINIKDSIMGKLPYDIRAIMVSDGSERQRESTEIFEIFKQMQNAIMRSAIGVSFPGFVEFNRITTSVGHVTFYDDGGCDLGGRGHTPDESEAAYVVGFAINTIIQIESLVGDIDKPFKL